jgi:hypothetical protein
MISYGIVLVDLTDDQCRIHKRVVGYEGSVLWH